MRIKLRFIFVITVFGLLLSCSVRKPLEIGEIRQNYPIDARIVVDSTNQLTNIIKKYSGTLKATMNEVVGYSSQYMPTHKPESLLSNMVADFTYKLGKTYCEQHNLSHTVDASIVNIHGLRKAMPEGKITLGDVYEISPFENKLFIVAMYGKDLRKLFDHITRSGGEGVGNIQLKANEETKKLEEAYIGGELLQDEKLYHIISIDYLINGGDGMVAFSKNVGSIDINMKSRDALLEYVKTEHKANRPLKSKLDNRISYE